MPCWLLKPLAPKLPPPPYPRFWSKGRRSDCSRSRPFGCARLTSIYMLERRTEEIYHLALDSERSMGHAILNGTVIVECYESKSSWSSCFFVHHKCCVKDCPKLFEVVFEFFFNDILSNSANKDLRGTILFVSRNCSFRIDLILVWNRK